MPATATNHNIPVNMYQQIPVIINYDRPTASGNIISPRLPPVRKTIRTSQRVLQAAALPTFINLNARSIYNKQREFELLVEQYEADIVFMTETWERKNLRLEDIINLENYKIVTEVKQRDGIGGKTALFISEDKYHIRLLCPDIITVPIGVEVVWSLVTSKSTGAHSDFRSIAIATIYCKPRSRKKTCLLYTSPSPRD